MANTKSLPYSPFRSTDETVRQLVASHETQIRGIQTNLQQLITLYQKATSSYLSSRGTILAQTTDHGAKVRSLQSLFGNLIQKYKEAGEAFAKPLLSSTAPTGQLSASPNISPQTRNPMPAPMIKRSANTQAFSYSLKRHVGQATPTVSALMAGRDLVRMSPKASSAAAARSESARVVGAHMAAIAVQQELIVPRASTKCNGAHGAALAVQKQLTPLAPSSQGKRAP
jgi:hypothetical protein